MQWYNDAPYNVAKIMRFKGMASNSSYCEHVQINTDEIKYVWGML